MLTTLRTEIHGPESIQRWVSLDAPLASEKCDLDGEALGVHTRLVVRVEVDEDATTIRGRTVIACDRRPREWTMCARRTYSSARGREEFVQVGSKMYAQLSDVGELVGVDVYEDPDGPYWGWVGYDPRSENDGRPSMIRPTRRLFLVQSDDGYQDAVKRGLGEIVRLQIRRML